MMKCDEIQNKMSAFLDGESSQEERRIIQMHLKNCVSCQKELRIITKINKKIESIPTVEVDSEILDQIFAKTTRKRKVHHFKWSVISIAASILISLWFGNYTGNIVYQDSLQDELFSSESFTDIFEGEL